MRKVLTTIFVLAIATLGLAACGGSKDNGGAVSGAGSTATTAASGGATTTAVHAGGAAGATVSVKTQNFAFDPTTASAPAGKIHFVLTNADTTNHTFTIDGTKVDIKLDPSGSGTADDTFKAGTYTWHCRIHSTMKGTLTVT